MAINFPNNPAVNDTFTVSGTKFTFTGVKWETSAVVDISSDTTPQLGGTLDANSQNINNVNDLVVGGNLTVNGTTTTIDTAVTAVDSLAVDGDVSIGNSASTAKLTVTNNSGTGPINLGDFTASATNQNPLVRIIGRNAADSGTTSVDFYKEYQGGFRLVNNDTDSTNFTSFEIGGSERLRITSGGDIGIGDNAPNSSYGTNVSVHSTTTDGARIKISDGTSGKGNVDGLDIIHQSEIAYFMQRENNDMRFYTNNTERLRIDNVGSAQFTGQDSPSGRNTRISRYGSLLVATTSELISDARCSIDSGNGNITSSGTVKTGTISTTTAGGAGSNLSGDGRLTLQFPSGGGGGVGMFSVYSGTSKNIEFLSGGSATFAGTISDSIGPLRNIPLNDQSSTASYTLNISDAGKLVHASGTTSTVVVPNGVFGAGNAVTILNGDGSNTLTISQGSGFSLRNTANSSTGNRTLAVFGMATIYFTGSGVGYISGAGLS